jgi:hypothetical protein
MQIGFPAALTILLVGHAWALAQQPGSHAVAPLSDATGPPLLSQEGRTIEQDLLAASAARANRGSQPAAEAISAPTPPPAPNSSPTLLDPDPVRREACSDGDILARAVAFQGSAECLLWWFKNGRVPPLVTAGGDGKLDTPGTRVLVDNLDFDKEVRQGGRFTLGYGFESLPGLCVGANYFFVADRHSDVRISSDGNPILAQPFQDAVTGRSDASLVAKSGVAMGSVTIGARTSLWGAEANLSDCLIGSDQFHLAALAGFRFLQLDDEVTSLEQFLVSPNVPGFGGNRAIVQDEFRTVNRFYGGQVGLETGVRLGPLAVDFRARMALGQMQQVADVHGATTRLSPNGTATVLQGGLYALRSNSGRHERDGLAFLPELGLDVGWQVTPHWKVYAGYSLLWVSSLARAGGQIDPVVNVSQFPLRSANGPLVGPARPALPLDRTDFWAQGLNVGLELKY